MSAQVVVSQLAGPRNVVHYAGAGVDWLHALSAAAFAVLEPRRRRAALIDTTIAVAFATATARTARCASEGVRG